MEKDLKELRFNMTPDMENAFIEMVVIRQMLKGGKLNKKERQLFEKELKDLTTLFVLDFRQNNIDERKQLNDMLNS